MDSILIDVLVALGLALVSAQMAFLGVRVTFDPPLDEARKKVYRNRFITLGILAAGLTITQVIRTGRAQRELIAAINTNPPKILITNNVPPPTVIQQQPTPPLPKPQRPRTLVTSPIGVAPGITKRLVTACPAGATEIDAESISAVGNGKCGIHLSGNVCLRVSGQIYLLRNTEGGMCVDSSGSVEPDTPQKRN